MTVLPGSLPLGCGCDDPAKTSGLVSLDQALVTIAQTVARVHGSDLLPLHRARGRVLAEAISAQADMPGFDHSAMDGYALATRDLVGDGPWILPVTGRVAAGESAGAGATGACRIFTGAPVPQGCDAVVMQEQVTRQGDALILTARPVAGANIRRRGEEQSAGAQILPAGTVLTPRAIAACAASGHGAVRVVRPVRVAVIASGTEVTPSGTKALAPGQIWDVNTPMLQALLTRPDLEVLDVARIADSRDGIRDALIEAAQRTDLIVTTGGVSVGEEDHLRAAITAAGGRTRFAGVAIKPGKPVALGQIGQAVWLGLPGNPGAAFVTWSLFGEAVLQALTGADDAQPARRTAVLAHDVTRKPGRCELRPARLTGTDSLGRDVLSCPKGVNSGQVTGLAATEGLAQFPAEADHLPGGALIEFIPFPNT